MEEEKRKEANSKKEIDEANQMTKDILAMREELVQTKTSHI